MKHLRIRALCFAILLCALAFPLLVGDPTLSSVAVEVLLLTGVAVAWNIFSGYTGYISLGHATFFGLGAYSLVLSVQDWHLPAGFAVFLLVPLAGLVAGAFSVPLGWIVLRTRQYTFMVITIAIFFTFQLLAYNLSNLTGGSSGLFLPIPDWSADLYNIPFYYAALALLLLIILASWLTRRSRFGLILLAIRDDEERVLGLGIRTEWYKLSAYVLSAILTGMIGALTISFVGLITPSTGFDQTLDITVVAMTFLGGIGSVWGPLVGGLLLASVQAYLSQQISTSIAGINQMLFGGFLLLVILILPRGIVPAVHKRFIARRAARSNQGTELTPAPTPVLLLPQLAASLASAADTSKVRAAFTESTSLTSGEMAALSTSSKVRAVIPSRFTVVPRANHASAVIPYAPPSKLSTQRLRALRLESLSTQDPLHSQVSGEVSWRCPQCQKPFLLRGNECYCRWCGFTRPLS